MTITNKKILLLAPKFFGYEERIFQALRKAGMDVALEYIYKPSRQERYMSKLFKGFAAKKTEGYYAQISRKYRDGRFGFFLVVDGKGVPESFLRSIISDHPAMCSIYYSWDSLQYFDYLSWLKIFDRVYTFDYKDSQEYNIKYLPLFYSPELDEISDRNEKEFDLLFIATFKESRLAFINSITERYDKNLRIKVVLSLSVYRYIIDRLKGKKIRRKDVVFQPLPFESYLDLLSKTEVVLDYTPQTQTGLPMRIPEAIGARKKIITNNENVFDEFNHSPNVMVYDEDTDILPFIKQPKSEMPEREKYSIENWINVMLS